MKKRAMSINCIEKIFKKCYKESNESLIVALNMMNQIVFSCAVVRLGKLDSEVVRSLNKHSHHDFNFQKVILDVYEKIKSIHLNSSSSQYEMSLRSSRTYTSEEVLSALEDEHE